MNSIFTEDGFSKDDELRELKDENNRLLSLVAEKDLEMKNMAKKHESDSLLFGVRNLTNDAAAAKIVELSRKIRELNSELQTAQTKAKNFQTKCSEYQSKLNEKATRISEGNNEAEKPFSEMQKEEMKNLQERLRQGDFKLTEARTQISSLKAELKVLNKVSVLVQEVGEGVSVQALLNGERSSWRGRSQQVTMLHKKVAELKKQLEKMQSRSKGGPEDDPTGGGDGDEDTIYKNESSRGKSSSLTAARENIKSIEKTKMEQIQKLSDELSAVEGAHSSLKGKHEALKARNQVLANEGRSLKEQIKMLMEKAKHDEELVEALLKQQNQLRNALVESSKSHIQLNNIKNHNNNSSTEMQSLREEVAAKDAKLKQLQEQLQQLLLSNHSNIADSLEAHPLNNTNNNTDNNTHNNTDNNTHNNYNNNVNKLSSANEMTGLRTLNVTLSYERDKLKEVLEKVVDSNDSLMKKMAERESELRVLARKCGRLEGELKRLYAGSAAPDRRGRNEGSVEVEELKLKLETLEDEKRSLKGVLEAALKAKREQVAVCEQMLHQARAAFTEAVKCMSGDGDGAGGSASAGGRSGDGGRKEGGGGRIEGGGGGRSGDVGRIEGGDGRSGDGCGGGRSGDGKNNSGFERNDDRGNTISGGDDYGERNGGGDDYGSRNGGGGDYGRRNDGGDDYGRSSGEDSPLQNGVKSNSKTFENHAGTANRREDPKSNEDGGLREGFQGLTVPKERKASRIDAGPRSGKRVSFGGAMDA